MKMIRKTSQKISTEASEQVPNKASVEAAMDTSKNIATGSVKKSSKMRSVIHYGFLLTILALMIIPAAYSNFAPEVKSEADNRMLTEFPKGKHIKEQLNDYLTDRLGFRPELLAGYAAFNDKVFGLMTHPLYEYGKEGWSFFRFNDERFDRQFIRGFAEYIKRAQDFCEDRGVPFLFVISPEKARVYAEYLPDTIAKPDNTAAYLKECFDELGVNYLDEYDALIQHKAEGYAVFSKVYDAGHWNAEGMYAGSQAVIDKLQERGLAIEDIDLGDYHRVDILEKILPASNYPIHEWTYQYVHNDDGKEAVHQDSYLDMLMIDSNHNSAAYYLNESKPDAPALLMFQGSYYNSYGAMLQHQFSRCAQVHNYENIVNLDYYLSVFQPDVVVMENADYTLSNAYYSSLPLAEKQFYEYPSAEEFRQAQAQNSTIYVGLESDFSIQNLFISLPEGWGAQDNEGAWIAGTQDSSKPYDLYPLSNGAYLWGARRDALNLNDAYTLYIKHSGTIYSYKVKLHYN